MTDQPLQPPDGLDERGAAFWVKVATAFELETDERELLLEACRTIDLLEDLQEIVDQDGPLAIGSMGQKVAHPALAELRAHRIVLSRLTAQLALPDEDGESVPTARRVSAKRAAQRRWRGNVKAISGSPA